MLSMRRFVTGFRQLPTFHTKKISVQGSILASVRRHFNSYAFVFKRFRQVSIAAGAVAFATINNSSSDQMKGEENLEFILKNADQLFDEKHFEEVIACLSKYKHQNNSEIQWRKARTYYTIYKDTRDKAERGKLIRHSYELIVQALERDEQNACVHKWMAIVSDANAEYNGLRARILHINVVRKHLYRSIELNPDDPSTLHIIGMFEYSLAELPWIQRKILSAILTTLPTGSFEKALECVERAEKIQPGFNSANWLMLGKCYLALNRKREAKGYLETAANCCVLNEDDRKTRKEATELLKKL